MVNNNIGVPGVTYASLPGVYDWVTFANGGSGAGTGQYFPLILANMTQQGSAFGSASFITPSALTVFGVSASSTVTSSGGTVITGSLALSPGSSVTGSPTVTGVSDVDNPAAVASQAAAAVAFAAGQALPAGTTVSAITNGTTLVPGTYTAASSLSLAGTITLNAGGNPNAVFIVQTGTTLISAAATNVVLAGNAQAQNVFWFVGSAVTLGAGTTLPGTVIANTAITDDGGSTVHGRLVSLTAAVNLSATLVTVPAAQNSTPSFPAGTVFGPNVPLASYNLQTVSQAIGYFGAGSGAALMYATIRAINPTVPIYVAPVVSATGTQASQVITVTALANGSVSNGQTSGVVQYQVDSKVAAQALVNGTDNQTTIAVNLAAAINSNVNLPVYAVAASNVVTVTAKVPGTRGNDLRGFASVASGSGVTLSGAVNSPSNFTGGAGSDATGYTNVLNALQSQGLRYYYIVCEAGCDYSDGYVNGIPAEVMSFLSTEAEPSQGNRERALFGSNDTVSNTSAQTALLNFERIEVGQCSQLDLTPGEIAATLAGLYTLTEAVPLTAGDVNFDGAVLPNVVAPLNGSAPSQTDLSTCVVSGITPLKVGPSGSMFIAKRVTTRFFVLGGAGGNQEVLSNSIALNCKQQMIGQDTASGAPPVGPGITTPSKVRQLCMRMITQYGAAGLIDAAQTLAGLQVQQNPAPNDSSIGIIVPLYVNSLLHQVLINVQQTVSSI